MIVGRFPRTLSPKRPSALIDHGSLLIASTAHPVDERGLKMPPVTSGASCDRSGLGSSESARDPYRVLVSALAAHLFARSWSTASSTWASAVSSAPRASPDTPVQFRLVKAPR